MAVMQLPPRMPLHDMLWFAVKQHTNTLVD